MKRLSIGVLGLALLSACGQKHEQQTAEQCYPKVANAEAFIQDANVYCDPKTDCPSEVGLLAFEAPCGPAMCSAFLVGPELALTNSHCIPPAMKDNPTAPNSMRLVFPRTNLFLGESVGVKEVIQFSDITLHSNAETGKKADYALLKLNRMIKRGVLTLSDEGVPDGLELKLASVTPDGSGSMLGRVSVKSCLSVMASAIQPSYLSVFSSVISFSDCELIHGNSGSPLLDSEGKVRAIAHASIDQDQKPKVMSALSLTHLDDLSLATNASCIDIPNFHNQVNGDCNHAVPQIGIEPGVEWVKREERRFTRTINQAKEDLPNELNDWIATWGKDIPVSWELRDDAGIYSLIPKCISIRNILLEDYTTRAPRFGIGYGLDSKLRYGYRYEMIETETPMRLNLSVDSLKNKGRTNIRLARGSEQSSLSDISYCR